MLVMQQIFRLRGFHFIHGCEGKSLPSIDPENLSSQDVLDILLHLFRQKQGFVDLGHEVNNRETGWVNGYLFRLKPDGPEAFVVETVGSSVDKMAALREPPLTKQR